MLTFGEHVRACTDMKQHVPVLFGHQPSQTSASPNMIPRRTATDRSSLQQPEAKLRVCTACTRSCCQESHYERACYIALHCMSGLHPGVSVDLPLPLLLSSWSTQHLRQLCEAELLADYCRWAFVWVAGGTLTMALS